MFPLTAKEISAQKQASVCVFVDAAPYLMLTCDPVNWPGTFLLMQMERSVSKGGY